jgi:hypothetical protein
MDHYLILCVKTKDPCEHVTSVYASEWLENGGWGEPEKYSRKRVVEMIDDLGDMFHTGSPLIGGVVGTTVETVECRCRKRSIRTKGGASTTDNLLNMICVS